MTGNLGSVRATPARTDDRLPLAIAAGLAAAIVGGLIWAAIAIFANLEIGWAAWGIGLLVGLAMARATVARSRKLAVTAAVIAIVGLVLGKAFAFAGSTGVIADEFLQNDEWLASAYAWKMYADRELTDETLAGLDDTYEAGDTLSDALWDSMRGEAAVVIAQMTEDEREQAAQGAARMTMANIGLLGGITTQLSAFDLLFMLLAVATAFRIMSGAVEEEEGQGATE